jgi:DNA invertase Pin-like site-specific DNA recombinase
MDAIIRLKMQKVFAYIRVSSPGQVSGDGFLRQMNAIQAYADARNLQLLEIYREEGISGTTEHRPALAKMLISLEQNGHGVHTVIIEKLDRLARDLMTQEFIVRDFQRQGFQLISVAEGEDLCGNDPTRKLIRQIMGSFAEFEKTMLVAKLKAARERIKQRDGKCEGRRGYQDSVEGREIISRIQQLRRKPRNGKRMTYQQIADQLNLEGITSLDGRQWTIARVQQTFKAAK